MQVEAWANRQLKTLTSLVVLACPTPGRWAAGQKPGRRRASIRMPSFTGNRRPGHFDLVRGFVQKVENDFCVKLILTFVFILGAPQNQKKLSRSLDKRARWGGTAVARAFLILCLAIADNLACNCRSTGIGGMVLRAAMLMALTARVQGTPPRTLRELCFICFLLVCERVVTSSLSLVVFLQGSS